MGRRGDEDALGKKKKTKRGEKEHCFIGSGMKIETQGTHATLRVLPSFINIHERHSIHPQLQCCVCSFSDGDKDLAGLELEETCSASSFSNVSSCSPPLVLFCFETDSC